MEVLFSEILSLAIAQRPALAEAIGFSGTEARRDARGVPSEIAPLYRVASGTPRGIADQSVMDIVPGFRLIHQAELPTETASFRDAYPALGTLYPFLADYSSCYYAVDSADGTVLKVDVEFGATPISQNLEQFLKTVLVFYRQGVYFLDSDGYLDYDENMEGKIGAALNQGYAYWTG